MAEVPKLTPAQTEQLAQSICSAQSLGEALKSPVPEGWAGAAYLSTAERSGKRVMVIKLRGPDNCLLYEVEDPEAWIAATIKLLLSITRENITRGVLRGFNR